MQPAQADAGVPSWTGPWATALPGEIPGDGTARSGRGPLFPGGPVTVRHQDRCPDPRLELLRRGAGGGFSQPGRRHCPGRPGRRHCPGRAPGDGTARGDTGRRHCPVGSWVTVPGGPVRHPDRNPDPRLELRQRGAGGCSSQPGRRHCPGRSRRRGRGVAVDMAGGQAAQGTEEGPAVR